MGHNKENSPSHNRAEKEIEIYKKLKEASDYTEYISDLVFAKDVIDDYGLATYFIFVYNPGNTLDKYIKSNNKTKSFDEIQSIYNRLKECLAFIHRNGVVHRDISPDNIFMTEEKLLLFDFDASCLEGIDCETHDFKGKAKYATKNALNKRGKRGFITYYYTPSTDNYALVVILKNDLIQLAKTDDDKKKVTDFAENEFSLIRKEMNKETHTRTSKGRMRKGRRTRKTKKGGYNRTAMGFAKFGGTATTACSSCTHQQTKFPASELLRGGACPCAMAPQLQGGYKATKRNLKYLKLWKQGKSIGFTMRSSLKAKGLIPRANGTYRVSPKYR
jgi:serine/threonine protein kinase